MTKADLIESVYLTTGFSKKESAAIVEMVFDLMKSTLEQGEKIKIAGFGNFVVKDKGFNYFSSLLIIMIGISFSGGFNILKGPFL